MIPTAPEKRRLRKSVISRIGDENRRSQAMNAASSASPPGQRHYGGHASPADVARPNDSEHDDRDSSDRQQHADRIQATGLRVARVGNEPGHEHERDGDDRDVDEEHRAPPEVRQQQAAGDRADRDREADRAGPDPDRLRPLGRVEDVRNDRQGQINTPRICQRRRWIASGDVPDIGVGSPRDRLVSRITGLLVPVTLRLA